ncbi:MAG: acylphosphatase [Sphingobacteriaceae bacterium]
MVKTRLRIFVKGKVQGVFFRESTKAVADHLGIKGLVKNEADGSVYLEAEGEKHLLDAFLEWCAEGPEKAEVSGVETHEAEVKNYRNFELIKKDIL